MFTLPLYLQVVIGLLILVGVDVLFGVVKAVGSGAFSLQRLPSFLATAIPFNYLAPFIGTVLTDAVQPNGTVSSTAFTAAVATEGGALALKLLSDIGQKLAAWAPTPQPPVPPPAARLSRAPASADSAVGSRS